MGLCLFFLPNFPGTRFIQGGTFIPYSRVRSADFYLMSADLVWCKLGDFKEDKN